MPERVRDHLRACSDCQLFLQRWNAVELSFQSMRSQTPPPSSDLERRIRLRIADERPLKRRYALVRPMSFALAGTAMLLVLVFLGMLLVNTLRGPDNQPVMAFDHHKDNNPAATIGH